MIIKLLTNLVITVACREVVFDVGITPDLTAPGVTYVTPDLTAPGVTHATPDLNAPSKILTAPIITAGSCRMLS